MQGLAHLRGFIETSTNSPAPQSAIHRADAPGALADSNIKLQSHNDLRYTDCTFPKKIKKAAQIGRIISTIRKKITEDLNCNETDFTKMLPVALPTLISNRQQALRPLDNQDLKVSNNEKLKELATALLNDYKEDIIEEAISEITRDDILLQLKANDEIIMEDITNVDQVNEAADNVSDTEWNNDQITNYKDLRQVILDHIQKDTKNVRAYTAFTDSQHFNNLPNRSRTLIRSYVTSSCTPDPTSKIDGAINCYADYSNQEDNTTTPDPQTFPTMKLTRKRY